MSAELRQDLAGSYSRLSSDVETFLKNTASAHESLAVEQRERLDEYVQAMRHEVEVLRHEAKAFLDALEVAQQAMAVEQRQWLSAERTGLTQDVRAVRAGRQAEFDEVRADQRDARRLWEEWSQLPHQQQAQVPDASPAPIPSLSLEKEEETQLESAPAVMKDELTTIWGIGPAMAERLNEAGIFTLAQLAQANADDVRQGLGDVVGRLAKVEVWISQAQEMKG